MCVSVCANGLACVHTVCSASELWFTLSALKYKRSRRPHHFNISSWIPERAFFGITSSILQINHKRPMHGGCGCTDGQRQSHHKNTAMNAFCWLSAKHRVVHNAIFIHTHTHTHTQTHTRTYMYTCTHSLTHSACCNLSCATRMFRPHVSIDADNRFSRCASSYCSPSTATFTHHQWNSS